MAHDRDEERLGRLTPREQEVLGLLRTGVTNAEIAERLGVSAQAVGRHVSQVIAKLGVRNRYEAAFWPERPPWWVGAPALAPFAWLWRKASTAMPAKLSAAAALVSGSSLAAVLGGAGLTAFLLANGGGGADATPDATATAASLVAAAANAGAAGNDAAVLEGSPVGTPTARPGLAAASCATCSETTPTPTPSEGVGSSSPDGSSTEQPPDENQAPASSGGEPPQASCTNPAGCSGAMAVDCDAATPGVQASCSYAAGEQFDVEVHVTEAPPSGYYLFQLKLRWDRTRLGYLPAAPADERLWSECDWAGRANNWPVEPSVLFGCVPYPPLAAPSYATVAVARFVFTCLQAGVAPLELLPREGDQQAGTHFVGHDNEMIDPALSPAQVSCGPCPAAGCPTPPPTPTPTPRLPPPAPTGSFAMAADCDAASAGVQTKCQYSVDSTFHIEVHVTEVRSDGYFAFEAALRWADMLFYQPAAGIEAEATGPNCQLPARSTTTFGPTSVYFGCSPFPRPEQGSHYVGSVLRFEFFCQRPGTTVIEMLARGTPGPDGIPIAAGSSFIDWWGDVVDPQLANATVTCT